MRSIPRLGRVRRVIHVLGVGVGLTLGRGAAAQAAGAADTTTATLSHVAVQLDFQQLRFALESAHAGLYDYEDKATWDRRFDSVAARLDRPMTTVAFYRVVAPLVASLRNGHTWAWLPDSASRAWSHDLRRLPIRFRILAGRVYVWRDLSEEGAVPPGAEVLAVNGEPTPALLARLRATVPGDGYIDTHRDRLLERFVFDAHYPLFVGRPDTFRLAVRVPERTAAARRRAAPRCAAGVCTVRVRALPDSALAAHARARYGDAGAPEDPFSRPSLALRVLGGDTAVAVLDVRVFLTTKAEPRDHFDTFLAGAFRELRARGTRGLVIDLRDNGGGDDHKVALLYSYLARGTFRLNRAMSVRNLDYAALGDTGYRYNDFQYAQARTGEITVAGGARTLEPYAPSPDAFGGRVVVLVDGGTYSAASGFAALVHGNRRGVFVGEEAGGAYDAAAGGRSVGVRLRHSGITVQVPPLKTVYAVPAYDQGRGVRPEHPVTPTIGDVLAGRDPALAAAVRVARAPHGS